jgi:hypothetical protein
LIEVDTPNVETIGVRAFCSCSGLKHVSFPKCTKIGAYGFQTCDKILTMNFPELKTLGGYVFQSCNSVETLVFPKLEAVGTADLYACVKLHTVDLHVCTSISGTAFPYSSKLVTVILRSPTVCSLGSGAFNNTPVAKGTGFIYVPDELVDSYKSATNWANFAEQIKPISELEE